MNIAVIGATGLVGQKMLSVLHERNIKITNLHLLASAKSAGKSIQFNNETYIVNERVGAARFESLPLVCSQKTKTQVLFAKYECCQCMRI